MVTPRLTSVTEDDMLEVAAWDLAVGGLASDDLRASRHECGSIQGFDLVRVRVTHAQDRGEDVPSSIIAEPVTASEESTWSARSVTSTNDVDADQR